MAEQSGIVWTDATFNPWIGCTKVSAGCSECYAERDFADRRKWVTWGPNGSRLLTSPEYWRKPIKWNADQHARACWAATYAASDPEPFRVFTGSLCDVMEDWEKPLVDRSGDIVMICPGGHIDTVSPSLNISQIECSHSCGLFMVPMTVSHARKRLFKLIGETTDLTWLVLTKRIENVKRFWANEEGDYKGVFRHFENVHLGVTVETQKLADERIPLLLSVRDRAAKIFLSVEPMLGPVNLRTLHWFSETVDWVIVGCESGPKRRPMELAWAIDLREQCREKGIAFFAKQFEINGKVTDNIRQFPKELQVREFPK